VTRAADDRRSASAMISQFPSGLSFGGGSTSLDDEHILPPADVFVKLRQDFAVN